MNCDSVHDLIRDLAAQTASDSDRRACTTHIEGCPDCRAALRGAEALIELRRRKTGSLDEQLFDSVVAAATNDVRGRDNKQHFWIGAGIGGAIAASLFALAITFGWTDVLRTSTPETAEFVLAMNEPRQMNLAFETDRQLQGATISILISGDVEIDGYGSQHELTWTEDLDAGINRLSLPVLASGNSGGKMVVRLSHPQSKQVFVINLRTES